MIRTAIVGATGYVGGELLRILGNHPGAEVTVVTSDRLSGEPLSGSWPQLAGTDLGSLVLQDFDAGQIAGAADVAFVALPHTRSMPAVAELREADVTVIDMSADFRLSDAALYQSVYGEPHTHPELLKEAVYGLPELFREKIAGAKLIASPGCYPTATLLALLPLAEKGFLAGASIVVDAKSGVSGAGKVPGEGNLYGQGNENFTAYKVGVHRHAPEMELYLGVAGMAEGGSGGDDSLSVLFVPHLVPMDRGILATAYVQVDEGMKEAIGADRAAGKATGGILDDVRALYEQAYANEPFVTVLPGDVSPQTKAVRGTNRSHIGLFYHAASERLIIVSAIDNLVKGAAGQGAQAMNIIFGLDEQAGLEATALLP